MQLRRGLLVLMVGVTAVASLWGRSQADGPTLRPNDGDPVLVGPFGQPIPPAPAVVTGPLPPEANAAIADILTTLPFNVPADSFSRLAAAGDPRVLWFLTDLRPFLSNPQAAEVVQVFERLTGSRVNGEPTVQMVNYLIAWDLPAPPDFRATKRALFGLIEPAWQPFFDDAESLIDWRLVGWGGVFIDDRPQALPGLRCSRGCIPALDDPAVTPAADGDWYPEDALVFGVEVNGAARAYPKNLMEVHEMVNDSLGGRRIGIPYCTLCGSAQAYLTDDQAPFQPVLRTSGLLSRSNKLMYDISTWSAIDTFSGRALSGPLRGAAVRLTPISVITSTWGQWRQAHPQTTILAEDGGLSGRRYPMDPLGGRDDAGPIFPVGDVDPRLPLQEQVLGVIAADGTPVAFPVANAVLALQAGQQVELRGVRLELEGSGLRAFTDGRDAGAHQAFWFAWSQFQPGTLIWERS